MKTLNSHAVCPGFLNAFLSLLDLGFAWVACFCLVCRVSPAALPCFLGWLLGLLVLDSLALGSLVVTFDLPELRGVHFREVRALDSLVFSCSIGLF